MPRAIKITSASIQVIQKCQGLKASLPLQPVEHHADLMLGAGAAQHTSNLIIGKMNQPSSEGLNGLVLHSIAVARFHQELTLNFQDRVEERLQDPDAALREALPHPKTVVGSSLSTIHRGDSVGHGIQYVL